jgi:hypothetical protein
MGKNKLKERLRKGLRQRSEESSKRKDEGSGNSYILSGNFNRFKPKPEDECIFDIIPYFAGKFSPIDNHGNPKNPYDEPAYVLEFWQHQNIGVDEMGRCLCLAKTFGKRCPVCEDRIELIKNGGNEETIKAIKPKPRCAYNIVAYHGQEEKKGIQIYELSWHYGEKEFQIRAKKRARGDEESDSILYMDPKDGKSIEFTQTGKEASPWYKLDGVTFSNRDYEISDKLLESAHCLEDLLTNSLPKDDNGEIDWDEAYRKNYEFYHAEPTDGEEIEKPTDGKEIEKKKEEKVKKKEEKVKKKEEKVKKKEKGNPSEIDWSAFEDGDDDEENKEKLLKKLDEFPEFKKKIEEEIEKEEDEDELSELDVDDIIFYIISVLD